ncbi:MAG: PKD domain-containing protein [Flavobacteriales bacterium]|jgi:gliding motility-associated-like protein|nr:PKD domain-containing protein [Flavobacteriales bacterium]
MLASHVPGGNLTYQCLGNNQFSVTLTLYEDCGDAFEPLLGTAINVNSSCGHNFTMLLNNTVYQQEISQLCPSSIGQSECNGGGLPGIFMHQWSGVITLPAQCNNWRFEYDNCCRDNSSNLVGSSSNYYFYADLNNLDAPCNSSPTITAPPIPYYCVNQPVCYNLGIVETDGDSLVYSLVAALDNATTPLQYQGGFSGSQPIQGITIDPNSGLINFVPTVQGNYVVVIQVDEYLNGVLVGTIIQDFTFEIAACSNQIVSCNNANISNVVGSVTQINSTTLEMCEGIPFSFDLTFSDPDINDSVFISTNIDLVLNGAVVTYSYPNAPATNVMNMNVSWTPPAGSSNSNNSFTVTVRDNACPVSGQQTLVYNIKVIGGTYVGPDLTICEGDSVELMAVNGSVFNWYMVSGEPISVGTNFSCDNCASPIVNIGATSTYEVVSDLSGNCVNRDTITINVAPNFTYSIHQSSSSGCLGTEIQLEVIPDTPNNYTYLWSPVVNLDNSNIANPIFSPSVPGTFQYGVEISSPQGCVKYDSIGIVIDEECLTPLILNIQSPTCNGGSNGALTIGAFGNDGPPWTIELLNNLSNVISTVPNVMDSIVFNNLLAGNYTVRITDTTGFQVDTIVSVTEPTVVSLSLANDTTICEGGTVYLNGDATGGNGTNSYVYHWSGVTGTSANETAMPLVNTTYDVYVLDSLNCSSDTLSINVSLFPPIITSTEGTDTVCPGDAANIEASASGGHGGVYFYDWYAINGTLIGSGANIAVTPTDSVTTYYVQVTDDCETPMELDSVIVYWYPLPNVDFEADNRNGCYPISVNFSSLTPVNEVSTLEWSFGNGITVIGDNNPANTYTFPGIYDVKLTVVSPDGCVNDTTKVAFIEAFDYPIAEFQAFPNPTNIFESTVAFTNESSSDAVEFEWFFRDTTLLDTSRQENPSYQFSSEIPNVYPVELVVTNENGCTDTTLLEVIVNGVYNFYAPTAFSPNGDHTNDVFQPFGEGVEHADYSIQIFDRDGHLIFSSKEMNMPWDGKYLGKVVKEDVYVWKIVTKDRYTGKMYEYYGHVTLIK